MQCETAAMRVLCSIGAPALFHYVHGQTGCAVDTTGYSWTSVSGHCAICALSVASQ